MRFAGFIGPSYTLRSKNVDCQRCVNLYPEMNELGTGKEKEIAALVATPGLSHKVTIGSGPIRAMHRAANGRVFIVSGNKLFELSSSMVATERGTLNSLSGPVSIADTKKRIAIVDGTVYGFFLEFTTNNFTAIPFPAEINGIAFVGSTTVIHLDGYFIFNHKNNNDFFISGHVDSTVANDSTIDALEFASSEGSPDPIVGLVADHQNIWALNEQTTEMFFNSGAVDFPFEPVQGAFIEVGLAAPFSIAKMTNTVFWLGRDAKGSVSVYMAEGYQPKRISTHAIELAISGYGDITQATAYCYSDLGHNFYVINFPDSDSTWVYDTATNLWHERAFLNHGVIERHRGECHVYAFGMHLVGDYANGKVYEMSDSVMTDDGVEILRRRAAPHLSEGLKPLFHECFQLDVESGVGLDGLGQGTDPKIMLRFSDDGGHSWSNEKWGSVGKIGQTKVRAIWRRLGSSPDRVYELSITDPVKVVMIGAELTLSKGAG